MYGPFLRAIVFASALAFVSAQSGFAIRLPECQPLQSEVDLSNAAPTSASCFADGEADGSGRVWAIVGKNGKIVNLSNPTATNMCLRIALLEAAQAARYNCLPAGGAEQLFLSFKPSQQPMKLLADESKEQDLRDLLVSQAGTVSTNGGLIEVLQSPWPKCMRAARRAKSAYVVFDVSPAGAATNGRVVFASDDCAADSTIEALQYLRFDESPSGASKQLFRKNWIDGLPEEPQDPWSDYLRTETRARLKWSASCVTFDPTKLSFEAAKAEPALAEACQRKPIYPPACTTRVSPILVSLLYDVSPSGEARNIRTVESKSDCLSHFAAQDVRNAQFASTKTGFRDIGTVYFFEARSLEEAAPPHVVH